MSRREERISCGRARSDMTTLVRPATIADAPRLSQLGAHTFRETFEGENTPDDMASYLAEAFTPDRQAAEIEQRLRCRAACGAPRRARGGEAGWLRAPGVRSRASRSPGPRADGTQAPLCDPLVAGEGRRPSAHGRGPGRRTCPWCEDPLARVWERNHRAVAFYGKHGFSRVGEHPFVLGSDAQTDWLLARPL